jgi:Glycosyl transferase family 2
MPFSPIALFVYNRPSHALRVLEALALNTIAGESELYIFSDGPKSDATPETIAKIQSVRAIIRKEKWCQHVHIIEQDANLGLAHSVISGISGILKAHPRVIVLEDDIVPSPVFLSFMNEALDFYESEEEVISISSFNFFARSTSIPDIFFSQLIDCWGWATWRRGWALFEPDTGKLLNEIDRQNARSRFNAGEAYDYYGMLEKANKKEIDSWAIRWYASGFIHNKLSLYPKISLTQNIGFDGTGVNSGHHVYTDGRFISPEVYPSLAGRVIENNLEALREFYEYFHHNQTGPLKKWFGKLVRLFS